MINIYAERDLNAYKLAAQKYGIPLEDLFFIEEMELGKIRGRFSRTITSKPVADRVLEWKFNFEIQCAKRELSLEEGKYNPLQGLEGRLTSDYYLILAEPRDSRQQEFHHRIHAELGFNPKTGAVGVAATLEHNYFTNRNELLIFNSNETAKLFGIVERYGAQAEHLPHLLIGEMVGFYNSLRESSKISHSSRVC